ncbi:MAG: SH3 domain-containing protein [Muribaculaceae bacterium]|nr:SH3 domain-containing protein [Muribaculaceae bacterium]
MEYEAPLWETKFGYNLYKGDRGGDVFIYTLESNDGQQISFSKADGVLEEDEYEDIFNILLRGEFVGESKKTKILNFITGLFSQATEIGSDLSAKDLVDQINDVLAEKTKMKVLGNYSEMSGEQLKGIITGIPQSTSQTATKNDISSSQSLYIMSEETSRSKNKSIFIIIGIIAFLAIVVACILISTDDNDNDYDYDYGYSYEEDYTEVFSNESPHSCTVVVDSDGEIVGEYVSTNASTYTVFSQDSGEVPINGHHLVTISAEDGQGYLDYDKNIIVRREPSESSKPVGQIEYWPGYINESIPCLGYDKGWYMVKVNGKIGYIHEDDVEWSALSN